MFKFNSIFKSDVNLIYTRTKNLTYNIDYCFKKLHFLNNYQAKRTNKNNKTSRSLRKNRSSQITKNPFKFFVLRQGFKTD